MMNTTRVVIEIEGYLDGGVPPMYNRDRNK
jgi:hypothetical protein